MTDDPNDPKKPKVPPRDPAGGIDGRDAGIEQVMDGEETFADRVWKLVAALPPGTRVIGEDIRIAALKAGIPAPHHPNAWGGAIYGCVVSGLLRPTDSWQHMNLAKSHRRKSPEYIR